jgi:hypothetical protein
MYTFHIIFYRCYETMVDSCGIIHETSYDNLTMERHIFKNVNIYLITNICTYLETSGGQSSNLYLNVAHFFNTNVN